MDLQLTPSATAGPYFTIGLTRDDLIAAELVAPDHAGAIRIRGGVVDGEGEVVPDGLVELWQADDAGHLGLFGRCGTDDGGGFEFLTVKPGLVAGAEGQSQAPHIDVGVFARGLLKRLVTRIYFPDEDAANAADPVLSSLEPDARATLVAHPEGDGVLRFDIRLQGDGQTTFFAV